jgi:hypothetical protein
VREAAAKTGGEFSSKNTPVKNLFRLSYDKLWQNKANTTDTVLMTFVK